MGYIKGEDRNQNMMTSILRMVSCSSLREERISV
jgi:hypothetical protein